MSPAALDIPPANANANAGDALVIGSLVTAADGTYQHVISSLSGRTVERQLVDRILDQAVTLENERFTDAYVVLGTDEYNVPQQRLGALLSAVLAALKPLGRIHLHNLTESREVASSGFSLLSTSSELVAQKPASAPPKSVLLPRRANVNGAGAAKKKQMLWSFAAAPPVDPETLLTPSDRVRPAPCEPADGSAARRKKACKNCTCGLAEIEAEEEARAVKVVLDATADADSVRRAGPGAAAKVTSSCGSCYLGDAFRCASCPYLGLPAFEPGQKVELVGMGDDF